MKTSPTQRSLLALRQSGHRACVVEKWIAQIKQRVDAFNFGDILAVHPERIGAVLVQSTSGDNVSKRIDKIKENAAAKIWLLAKNRILVHGWRMVGPRGARKTWQCREIEVTLEMLNEPPAPEPQPAEQMALVTE